MQFSNFLEKMWKIFLDLLFPPRFEQDFLNNLTTEKFLSLTNPATIPPLPNTLAIVSYKDPLVKKAIWSLKFKNNFPLAKLFAEVIYENLIEELAHLSLTANFKQPLLIAIPLSRQGYKKRGYNQVELIAQAIVKLDQNNFLEYRRGLLKKIKDTPPQSHAKNKTERLKNLAGCFKISHPEIIAHRNIILLDDVTTTGATLAEAVKIIKTAHPQKIMCVTLAH